MSVRHVLSREEDHWRKDTVGVSVDTDGNLVLTGSITAFENVDVPLFYLCQTVWSMIDDSVLETKKRVYSRMNDA